MMTSHHAELSRDMIHNRVEDLIGQFFKILPMREHESPTLNQYISSLLLEMLGMQSLMLAWQNDGMYMSLLGILQYLLDHPECDVPTVKREIFRAISVIKLLQKKYTA